MASMQRRFVVDFAHRGGEAGRQQRLNPCYALFRRHHPASLMYLERNMVCATTNAIISPMKPNSLKLTQVEVGKLKAIYRLITPIAAKKAAQAMFRRVQIGSGKSICAFIIKRIKFLFISNCAPTSTMAKTQ